MALFATSALRHHLFRSGGLDLGFFDQLVYLISTGQKPVSSILGFHVLADHAAFMVYLLAPLYWIWPNVHTLLAVQAIGLAAGSYPLWKIARLRGASNGLASAIALAYALYPLVLTANLFDFHPEVLAVPALLFAALFAEQRRIIPFLLAIAIALGGKEVVSLTVVAFGVWLCVRHQRPIHGALAILLGTVWFLFATQWLIPHFGAGKQASGVMYYAYLGTGVGEIARNAILHPGIWAGHVLSFRTLKYLAIIFIPVAWGIHPKQLWPLIGALPTLALNLLSDPSKIDMTSPSNQYSALIVPFVALAVLGAATAGKTWIKRPMLIAGWAIGLILIGGTARLLDTDGDAATDFGNHAAAREAIAQIDGDGGVLTMHDMAPHLSQRKLVQFIDFRQKVGALGKYQYILLNLKNEKGGSIASNYAANIQALLEIHPSFTLKFCKNDIYLYQRVELIVLAPITARAAMIGI